MTSTVDGEREPPWGAIAVDLRSRNLPSLKATFLVDRVPDRGRVLEVGSGEGKLLRTLAGHHPHLELHGCDVRAPRTAPDAYRFHLMTDAIPLEDDSVDVVLMFDVLEHVPDPDRMLRETARVCRPGGQLLAFIPVEGELLSFYELYRRLLGRDTYVITKEHIQAFTHDALRALLERHFTIAELSYAYHGMGQLMDATFFAAAKAKSLRSALVERQRYYHDRKQDQSGASAAMNKLLEVGNLVAWAESTALRRNRFGSAGILVAAKSRKATSGH